MKKAFYKNVFAYVSVLLVVVIAAISYFYYVQYQKLKTVSQGFEDQNTDLARMKEEKIGLEGELLIERNKNAVFESQISEISGAVGKLNKLSKLDPELLQKYSKVYFLNEHYVPKQLVSIDDQYMYNKNNVDQIHASTSPYLVEMIEAAKADGFDLLVISAYRSYEEQSHLKGNYTFTYGSGANRFSADQGYSEHQLGTAVDFTSGDLGASFTSFGKSKEYEWLLENAYKYGFVLSYPEGNSYYQFEPWHWRFVGKMLAERLHEEKEYFYNLDQRKIDAYLVHIFD